MILPDKNIKLEFSLLNCGAVILKQLEQPQTVSSLWNKVKEDNAIAGYEKFILTLDYLFIIGGIFLEQGMLRRNKE